jgi:hypothetical protein
VPEIPARRHIHNNGNYVCIFFGQTPAHGRVYRTDQANLEGSVGKKRFEFQTIDLKLWIFMEGFEGLRLQGNKFEGPSERKK